MLSAFLKKLLFVRQLIMLDGKVQILGYDQLMLPVEFINVISTSKNIYADLKEVAEKKMTDYAKKIGVTEQGLLLNLVDIFETFGLGKVEIYDLQQEKKQAIIRIHNSTIGLDYLKNKKDKKPVCIITAAILAGMFSSLFKKKVNAEEKICMAQGADFCEFMIK